MTKTDAKRIALESVSRSTRPQVRFVVLKNRLAPPGQQDAGYIFSDRAAALAFGERMYHRDFAMIALTPTGSVDLTPA